MSFFWGSGLAYVHIDKDGDLSFLIIENLVMKIYMVVYTL